MPIIRCDEGERRRGSGAKRSEAEPSRSVRRPPAPSQSQRRLASAVPIDASRRPAAFGWVDGWSTSEKRRERCGMVMGMGRLRSLRLRLDARHSERPSTQRDPMHAWSDDGQTEPDGRSHGPTRDVRPDDHAAAAFHQPVSRLRARQSATTAARIPVPAAPDSVSLSDVAPLCWPSRLHCTADAVTTLRSPAPSPTPTHVAAL